jgi:homocysteine S-methyltransferase
MHARAWSAAANFTHPSVVREVHEDHVRAGAEVVIANTFGTNRTLLEGAGLGDRVRELNLAAMRLAREARAAAAGGRPVAVAGSINVWDAPASPGAARADLAEQAALLMEGGADLIALEMMVSVGEARLALEAALATGLPVWVGLSVTRAEDGTVVLLRDREPLEAAADALAPLGAAAFLVMHSLPEVTGPALRILRGRWKGPLGAYAHMGSFTMPEWRWENLLTPAEYADFVEEWIGLGARAVGGCCGLGPEYTAELSRRFSR